MNGRNRIQFGVVILAAGASSRMGRPKLLLPWRDTTILGHLVGEWRALGASPIAVVWAPARNELQTELDRLGVGSEFRIPNPYPEHGMFSSIRCAALWEGWPSGVTHVAFTLGDQPQVSRETLRALLEFASARPESICQPARHGRGRHPVIFPRAALPELAAAGESTLKELLSKQPGRRAFWESPDTGLDWDIDVPADYERALQLTRA